MKRLQLTILSLALVFALASEADATPTDAAFSNSISAAYVSAISANVSAQASSTSLDWAHFFSISVVDAAGASLDACPDLAGTQAIVYLAPNAPNLDNMKALLQMAFLGNAKLRLTTQPNAYAASSGTVTLCYLKGVTVYR